MARQFTDAIRGSEEIVRRYGTSVVPDLQSQVAMALAVRGTAYMELGRFDDALDAFGDVEERFRGSQAGGILDAVAMAAVNRGIALRRLGRIEEALESHDVVVRRFEMIERKEARAPVACALFQSGLLQGRDATGRRSDWRLRRSVPSVRIGHGILRDEMGCKRAGQQGSDPWQPGAALKKP